MGLSYYLVELKNSYILIPLMVVFAIILVYINGFLTSFETKDAETDTNNGSNYLKISLLVVLVVGLTIYINNIKFANVDKIITGPPPI